MMWKMKPFVALRHYLAWRRIGHCHCEGRGLCSGGWAILYRVIPLTLYGDEPDHYWFSFKCASDYTTYWNEMWEEYRYSQL